MTEPTKIKNWSAARSGAAITVSGKAEDGTPRKIADVRVLRPSREHQGAVVAVTRDGDTFLLMHA